MKTEYNSISALFLKINFKFDLKLTEIDLRLNGIALRQCLILDWD